MKSWFFCQLFTVIVLLENGFSEASYQIDQYQPQNVGYIQKTYARRTERAPYHCRREGLCWPLETLQCTCKCMRFHSSYGPLCNLLTDDWDYRDYKPEIIQLKKTVLHTISVVFGKTNSSCLKHIKPEILGDTIWMSIDLSGLAFNKTTSECIHNIEVGNVYEFKPKRMCRVKWAPGRQELMIRPLSPSFPMFFRVPDHSESPEVNLTISFLEAPAIWKPCNPFRCETETQWCYRKHLWHNQTCQCRQKSMDFSCKVAGSMYCSFDTIDTECVLGGVRSGSLWIFTRDFILGEHPRIDRPHNNFTYLTDFAAHGSRTGSRLHSFKTVTIKGPARCIEFDLFIQGPKNSFAVYFLSVDLRTSTTRPVPRLAEAKWHHWNFTVYSARNFMAEFFATVWDYTETLLAFDSIRVSEGACSGESIIIKLTSCYQGTCIVGAGINCTFDDLNDGENGWCVFSNITDLELEWTRITGEPSSGMTGPDHDVSGNGYYLYMGTSLKPPHSKAAIQTPFYTAGNFCISFMVYMSGEEVGRLDLILQDNKENKKVLSAVGDQGAKWAIAIVDLESRYPYQVVIEGETASGSKVGMAIDSFSISNGKCADPGDVVTLPEATTGGNTVSFLNLGTW